MEVADIIGRLLARHWLTEHRCQVRTDDDSVTVRDE